MTENLSAPLSDPPNHAQAQAAQGEPALRLLDALPDGYIRFDRDLNPTFLNAAGRRLYDQIHTPADPLLAVQAGALETSLLRSVFQTGQPVMVEYKTSGPPAEAVIEARYLTGEVTEGGVQTVLALLRDYTGRKRVTEAQQAGEQLIHAAMAHVGMRVYTQARDLSYRWIYDQQHGLLHPGGAAQTEEDFYAPEQAERLNQIKRQVLATGEPARQELHLGAQAGDRTFELFFEPTLDESGEISGLLCSALDITERKRIALELERLAVENLNQRELLARQNELLQAIVDENPSGLAVLSGPGLEHRFVNPAYRAMLPHPE